MSSKFIITILMLCVCNLARADYIEITLLGTGGPPPNIERFGPSTVIETQGRYFVFDVGRGATIRLQQAGIPLNKIEQVFLTHLHSDHISGLSDLWLTSWIWQRQSKMNVFGPDGTKDFANHLEHAFSEDIRLRTFNSNLNKDYSKLIVKESSLDNIIVYQNHDIKITAFRVNHGVVKQAYGYKFESGGRKIIISGDTTYSENLIKHAKNADVLIHEIAAASPVLLDRNTRLRKIMTYHTTPEQLSRSLIKIQPKYTILNHVLLFGITEKKVLAKLKSNYDGQLYIGKDLLKISIGNSIMISPFN
jgi:ribonuclease Z